MSGSWIEAAEAALAADASGDGVTVLRAHRPPLFDRDGLVTVALGAAAVGLLLAASLREAAALDVLGLLLRFLGALFTVRAVLGGVALLERVPVWQAAPRCGLVLTEAGILFRTPEGDVAVAREDVITAVEEGTWQARAGTRRFGWVYLVLHPASGRALLRLPPVFDDTPGVLAERLMRWRGPVPRPAAPSFPEVARLPSKVYDDAAAGRPGPDVVGLRHGLGWLRRGPYAPVVLAAVVLLTLRSVPETLAMGPEVVAGLAACLLIPLGWAWLARRHVAPRKGMSLVLTPAELLIRTRAGVHRAPWPRVSKVHVERGTSFTLVEGRRADLKVVIEREDDTPIRYDEAYLGEPADVVAAVLDAYRRGLMLPRTPDATT